jgi:signal transduction histidine kinase
MKRRSLLLMILIVLLPIALLTWFGLRMLRDEQALVQQRYRALMEQRLQDVNRTIALRFGETERRLQQITSLDNFALDELRAVVRREPQVTQLFVLTPDGDLMYPNPGDQLNGTEQSFLRQAFRMFADRDLQNAVALAEAGSAEQQLAKSNRFPLSRSTADTGRASSSGENGPPFESMIAFNDVEAQTPSQDQALQERSNTSEDSQFGARSGGMGGAGFDSSQRAMPESLPIAAAGNDALSLPDSFGPPMENPPASPSMRSSIKSARSANKEANDLKPTDSLEEKSQLAEQSASDSQKEAVAANSNDIVSTDVVQAVPGPPASAVNTLTDSAPGGDALGGGDASSQAVVMVDPSPMAMDKMAFQQNAQETVQSMPYRESRGWFVWYWDRGMNLVYWQRRPSGHIVGAALERARWIADLISWLPESDEQERDASGFDTTFRVITSAAEPVYNWGADSGLTEPPFCEVPLAGPLASWRLQCFVPMAQITAGGGRSAYLGFGSGLIAFALTLCGLTWILYRDCARDMREASQQVSFVNQVSHELKTPLTNIRMYAELLERDLEKVDEEQSVKPRRRLDIINAEAQRLSRLIGNVLTFARQKKKTLQISPARLDALILVNQIAERFSPSLEEKGIQLQLEGQSVSPLNLDADFIEQILGNLISNVEKYAASGKSLSIRTTTSDDDVTIDVIDAGPGIPKQFHGSVFEPFERLNNDLRASTGTGIGLSIARDLARIHKGDVTLEPSEKGCWFRVRLASM